MFQTFKIFVSYFTSIETLHMNLYALFTTKCSVQFAHYKRRQGQPRSAHTNIAGAKTVNERNNEIQCKKIERNGNIRSVETLRPTNIHKQTKGKKSENVLY